MVGDQKKKKGNSYNPDHIISYDCIEIWYILYFYWIETCQFLCLRIELLSEHSEKVTIKVSRLALFGWLTLIHLCTIWFTAGKENGPKFSHSHFSHMSSKPTPSNWAFLQQTNKTWQPLHTHDISQSKIPFLNVKFPTYIKFHRTSWLEFYWSTFNDGYFWLLDDWNFKNTRLHHVIGTRLTFDYRYRRILMNFS